MIDSVFFTSTLSFGSWIKKFLSYWYFGYNSLSKNLLLSNEDWHISRALAVTLLINFTMFCYPDSTMSYFYNSYLSSIFIFKWHYSKEAKKVLCLDISSWRNGMESISRSWAMSPLLYWSRVRCWSSRARIFLMKVLRSLWRFLSKSCEFPKNISQI